MSQYVPEMLPTDTFDDLGEWSARVSTAFVPALIKPTSASFSASMRTVDTSTVRLSWVQSTSHVLERTVRHIRSDGRARHIVVCLQLAGTSMVVQQGRIAELQPGDVTLYDTTKPYTLEHGTFECLGVVIPATAIAAREGHVDELLARRMPASDPVVSIVVEAISGMERQFAALPPFVRYRLGQHIVHLTDTLCAHAGSSSGASATDPKAERWTEIVRWIDDRLGDPELDPPVIAAAHFMSVRSLHNLARANGTTISTWIRRRRLDMCRLDLANPALLGVGVSVIGARWGFVNATHFSTAFRSDTGLTPSAYRQQSLLDEGVR